MAFFNLPSYLHELEIDGVKQNEDDDTQDFSLDNDDQNNENNPPEDNSGGDDDGEQVDVSGEDDNPDDDGEQVDVSGEDDEPDDDYNIPDEPAPDDNPDDGGEQVDVSGDDNTSEGEDDSQDNFDISSDDEGDGSDNNTGNNDEPSQEEPEDNPSEGDSTSAEISKVEEDIFSVLSPEQQNIRIFELKGNFAKTYDDIEDTLEKINSLTKTSENQSVLERVTKSLNSMRDMIQFYITNTFDTKSYIENSATYKKYLTALQVISNILKEVDSKGSKE